MGGSRLGFAPAAEWLCCSLRRSAVDGFFFGTSVGQTPVSFNGGTCDHAD